MPHCISELRSDAPTFLIKILRESSRGRHAVGHGAAQRRMPNAHVRRETTM